MKVPALIGSTHIARLWKCWANRVLVLLMVCMLASCANEDLYTDVTESDANTMLGLLLAQGISATKRPIKENLFAVSVPRSEFASAVDILQWYGLPKETFEGVGQMFPKTGLVSSPTEERIRFMHALAGNISEMLSNFDGVITARTILVLPSNDPYSNATNPASASVFLKIRPGFDTSTQIPQIKNLVMNSVEGLSYDRVAVTVIRSDAVDYFHPFKSEEKTFSMLGVSVPAESKGLLIALFVLAGVLVLGAAGAGAYIYLERQKMDANSDASSSVADAKGSHSDQAKS